MTFEWKFLFNTTYTFEIIIFLCVNLIEIQFYIYLYASSFLVLWHTGARGAEHPPFSNFLFTNLFSIKFIYFLIISSLFPYFNLFVSIFIQSYVNIKLHVRCVDPKKILIIHKAGLIIVPLLASSTFIAPYSIMSFKLGHVSIPKRRIFLPLFLFWAYDSSVLQNFKIFTHLLPNFWYKDPRLTEVTYHCINLMFSCIYTETCKK